MSCVSLDRLCRYNRPSECGDSSSTNGEALACAGVVVGIAVFRVVGLAAFRGGARLLSGREGQQLLSGVLTDTAVNMRQLYRRIFDGAGYDITT